MGGGPRVRGVLTLYHCHTAAAVSTARCYYDIALALYGVVSTTVLYDVSVVGVSH